MIKQKLLEDQQKEYTLYSVMHSAHLRDWYTSLGTQTLVSKINFSSSPFSVVFQQESVKVAINDFTMMHLIILKWLRIQQCREKGNETKKSKPKKKLSMKLFSLSMKLFSLSMKLVFIDLTM